MTVAAHGELRSAVASGPSLGGLRLFTLADDEQDELEVAALANVQHSAIHPNLPAFLALLDAWTDEARGHMVPLRVDVGHPWTFTAALGGGDAPTFADGLVTQQQLAAIGYGRTG